MKTTSGSGQGKAKLQQVQTVISPTQLFLVYLCAYRIINANTSLLTDSLAIANNVDAGSGGIFVTPMDLNRE